MGPGLRLRRNRDDTLYCGHNPSALIASARQRGVDLYPIAPYYSRPPERGGLLMGFASMSVAEIEQAVQIVAGCLRAMPDELAWPR